MIDVKEQLRAYFDEIDSPFEPAGLMQDPQAELPQRQGAVGRGVLVAAVAATVLLSVVSLPLLFLAGRSHTSLKPAVTTATDAPTSTTAPATTTTAPDQAIANAPDAPAEVFSWMDHDIGDWVTTDEITAVLANLSIQYAGASLDGEAVFELVEQATPVEPEFVIGGAYDEAVWTVGSADGENRWTVLVHSGDHIADSLEFPETDLTLPKGEGDSGGWGVFTVRGPNSDESLCIGLEAPTEIFGRYVEEDIYMEMIAVLASMMLEELGWVD